MRNTGKWIGVGVVALGLLVGCKPAGEKPPEPATTEARDLENLDPKSLYEVELKAPEGLSAGDEGILTLAIRPKEGAEVKPETPLRAQVEAKGGLSTERPASPTPTTRAWRGRGPSSRSP